MVRKERGLSYVFVAHIDIPVIILDFESEENLYLAQHVYVLDRCGELVAILIRESIGTRYVVAKIQGFVLFGEENNRQCPNWGCRLCCPCCCLLLSFFFFRKPLAWLWLIAICMNWNNIWKIQNDAMLCRSSPFWMTITHGVVLFHSFDDPRHPMTSLVVELSWGSPTLFFFVSVLFGHCVVSD